MIPTFRPVVFGPVADPPAWLAVLAALATRLADAWFLFLVVTLCYWLAPRVTSQSGTTGESLATRGPRATSESRAVGATLVGLALGSLAVTAGAKAAFAFPRPPTAGAVAVENVFAPLVASAVDPTGFGFPSGHALAATLVYGGFAAFLRVGTRRTRIAVAGVITVVVAATRVVLGVHYPADVVAGVGFGVVALAGFVRVARGPNGPRPGRALFLAGSLGALGVVAAAVGGHGGEAVRAAIAGGAGFGGAAVWRTRGADTTRVGWVAALAGLAVVGGTFGSVRQLADGNVAGTPLVDGIVVTALAAVGVGALIGWPAVVGRVRTSLA